MSILLLILSLHIYVMIDLKNYFISSGKRDDFRTIIRGQSPVVSWKTIIKLKLFFCYPSAIKPNLFKHAKKMLNKVIALAGNCYDSYKTKYNYLKNNKYPDVDFKFAI